MNARRALALVAIAAALATLAASAGGAGGTPVAAAGAWIRVDQLGYATAGGKRAYLMTTVPESGARFALHAVGQKRSSFTGAVGPSLGSWSKRFPYVYALDFDSLASPGRYVIEVSGPEATTSPDFAIGLPRALYTGALHNALSFYQAERDGPNFIRSPLRTAPGHLNDRHAHIYATPTVNADGGFNGDLRRLPGHINAAGGWWDAGDYLKFVQTTSYTVALMLTGVRDFPRQIGGSAGSSNFSREARFGIRWLMRMWNDRRRTLYYQVGIGNGNGRTFSDHDIWRLPQADDRYGGRNPLYRYIRHRPVFRAALPGSPISPNLAGRDAAAFGLCAQVYRRTARRLAARCLRDGEHIFALANTHPKGHLLTAIPFDFYPETQWRDDLELGAVELADALPRRRAVHYLWLAAHWARAYMRAARDASDTLNLYDVSGLAHFELYRAIGRLRVRRGLAVSRRQLVRTLRGELNRSTRTAGRDPFGFGFPWNVEDTASHGFGLSVMAGEYAHLTGDARFHALSERWLANVLGANAWGVSLAIGDGSRFPLCPQHQVANLAGSLDGTPPVLAGAVVEGPSNAASTGELSHMRRCPAGRGDPYAAFNNGAVFRDNVQSYSTVEPAIDLTASSPLAFAWQIASPRRLRR